MPSLNDLLLTLAVMKKVGPQKYREVVGLVDAGQPVPLDLMHPQAAGILRAHAGTYADALTLDEQVATLRANVGINQLYEDPPQ